MDKYGYRFSFGPWNIHEGADPFGPEVRPSVAFERKLELYKQMQFDVTFPRPGVHRVWVQFQRKGVVNTAAFNIPVSK